MVQWNMSVSVSKLYWTCAVFFIPGIITCIMVWMFTKYHYSNRRRCMKNVSVSLSCDTKDGDNEAQTGTADFMNTKSSISIPSDNSSVSTSSHLSGVPHVMNFRLFWNKSKRLFKTRIFVLMLMACFVTEGGYFASIGSLKQLLLYKFERTDAETGNDFGYLQYFGLAAPISGFIVDKLRHRQWFIIFGSCVFMVSSIILALGDATDFNRIFGLFGISVGLIVYGSAFWPSVASVVGKHLQIIAYGWTSAFSSFGSMILPLIAGYITDHSDVQNAQYLFMLLSIFAFMVSVLIAVANGTSEIDYLNRSIHKSETHT